MSASGEGKGSGSQRAGAVHGSYLPSLNDHKTNSHDNRVHHKQTGIFVILAFIKNPCRGILKGDIMVVTQRFDSTRGNENQKKNS